MPKAMDRAYDGKDKLTTSVPVELTLEEFLQLANDAQVIMLEGSIGDDQYQQITGQLDSENYDDDGNAGPLCHLCNKEILPDGDAHTTDDIRFPVYWKADVSKCEKLKDYGILQCCYCLNMFHRNKCSLSMSYESYIAVLKSRCWSCPRCVPVFVPRPKIKNVIKCFSDHHLLIKIFKYFNKLRSDFHYFLKPIESSCLYVHEVLLTEYNYDIR